MATQGIEIPSDLAKTWIRNYFTYEATETFLSLVDRKTIEMIPDLLDTKHVRLDPCILILYYVILWRGCFILNTRSYSSSDGCYAGQLYLCCLRIIPIWQREATGCVTDFVAAIFMTGISNESFDYETSVEMHKLACEYGKGLQMHVLDGSGNPTAAGPSWTDNDRRGMWELFQTDLFYHLIYNKPASLLRHLGDWRVNLPWLSLGSSPDNSAPLSTIAFLVRSRLTFILIEFFQKLKTLDTEPEAIATIEPLCHQVELLLKEWSIEAWLDRSSHDQMNLWILSGLILTGYTCILYMLRKATLLNSNSPNPAVGSIPRTDLALRASRRLLKLTYQMLHVWKFPAIEAISYILGAYRAHIAYATVASNALEAPHAEHVAADLELLDGVASTIENVASGEKDFAPLARAMRMLNADIRSKAETVETIQES
ncbi:hypothetical protein BS50DRAFT_616230 [Corynespora cassiicola Philippines]|uniref:Transcription factor domain-containing protein n=1 Tax=Corynespora cassiicola Philippines TaxID=1448308 RepID=A0A2T2PDT3_CORCC|nr:hypothetical protein BS50DRAFT_616230 [Corynespora cassiicola Philippines]